MREEDIKYIHELENRVQELEGERDEWRDTSQSYYMTNQELRGQNKRYREVIKNIDDIMRLKRRWNKEDMHIMNELKVLEESE